jgi:hypothetical protein
MNCPSAHQTYQVCSKLKDRGQKIIFPKKTTCYLNFMTMFNFQCMVKRASTKYPQLPYLE